MNVSILKQKNFLLLMQGKLVSLIGSQMQNFALSLYVLKITGSATKFASVLALTLVPQVILGPIAGVFADWFERKKIIVYLDMLNGIMIGIYAVIYKVNGGLTLTHIYFLVIAMSIISLLFNPAISTVIPTIVKKEELVDANGINSFIMNLGNLVAPAIAGFLFGVYGLFIILVINSISFVLSSISEMFINIPKTNKKPEKINLKSFYVDFSEGIKFIKKKKIMISVITIGVILNFAYSPVFSVGLTYISKQVLKVTDYQYGILEAILVIPMIIAPFFCSIICKKMKYGKILFLDILIQSALVGIMAIVPSAFYLNLFSTNFIPYISLISITFVITLITTIGNMALNIMFQEVVPLSMMGRVSAVLGAGCMAAVPLGQMVYGILFDKIQPWICVAITAIILFATTLISRKTLLSSDKEETGHEYHVDNEELIVSSPEVANAVSQED